MLGIKEPDSLYGGFFFHRFPLIRCKLGLQARLQDPDRLQHVGDLDFFPELPITLLEQYVFNAWLETSYLELGAVPLDVVLEDAEEGEVDLLHLMDGPSLLHLVLHDRLQVESFLLVN